MLATNVCVEFSITHFFRLGRCAGNKVPGLALGETGQTQEN